jgi:hypothetical protein
LNPLYFSERNNFEVESPIKVVTGVQKISCFSLFFANALPSLTLPSDKNSKHSLVSSKTNEIMHTTACAVDK